MGLAIDLLVGVVFIFLFGYGFRIGALLDAHLHMRVVSGLVVVAIAALGVGLKVLVHLAPRVVGSG